jgi:phi13 family phage major tail protein
MADTNKVRFGLRNVFVAPITDSGKALTYGTPIAWPGATEISLDPSGDKIVFNADDVVYWSADNNQGYTGKITLADIPEALETLLFGNKKDTNGVMIENADNTGSDVALMFEFSGDKNKLRHVMYKVSFSRSSIAGATKSDKVDVQTKEFEFTAVPDPYTMAVKAKATSDTTQYATWNTKVYVPVATA